VARAIMIAQPQAVDTASGTEAAPGKKDPATLRAFFKAIKSTKQFASSKGQSK